MAGEAVPVEWYPLPQVEEVQTLDDAASSVHRTSGQNSGLKSIEHCGCVRLTSHTPARTGAPPDLTILSTGSLMGDGRAKTYLNSTYSSVGGVSTPSLHLPPTSLSPNELDQLWQRFLSSAFISKQSRWTGHPGLGGRGCSCNCHQQLPQYQHQLAYTPFPHYKQLPVPVTTPMQASALPLNMPPCTIENRMQANHTYLSTMQNQPSSIRKDVAFTVAMPTTGLRTTEAQTTPTLMKGVSSSLEKHTLSSIQSHAIPSVVKGSSSLEAFAGDTAWFQAAGQSPTTPTLITQEVNPRLQQLTLQEACQLMKPNFINNSNLRQERLRERKRRRANMSRQQQGHVEKRDSSKHIIPSDENVLGFVKIVEVRQRPKMTYWQMYEQSKRYWEKLPEVKEKERVEKKKAQIRTNMLRVKIYQRVVLGRLRKKKRSS